MATAVALGSGGAIAGNRGGHGQENSACRGLPGYGELTAALAQHVATTNPDTTNGGVDNNMWASIVSRDGTVCAGGTNVFGGGLALYDSSGELIGGLGVSGDTSCADHNVAWRVRAELALDFVTAGVSTAGDDFIIFDIGDTGTSAGGFGHPFCLNPETEAPIAERIHTAFPVDGPTD